MEKIRVCHITTVHQRNDPRIYQKECRSLAKEFEVNLVVADGEGDSTLDNIRVYDIGLRSKNRFLRFTRDGKKAFKKAKQLRCNVYHIHDPELLRIGVKLEKSGFRVIYDAHEDLPRQILSKPYIREFFKPLLSKLIEKYEDFHVKRLSYIITATDHIKQRFLLVNPKANNVNNYPILSEFRDVPILSTSKKNRVCYVGDLSRIRGVIEMVQSLKFSKHGKLVLGGLFVDSLAESEVRKLEEWNDVDYRGFMQRVEMAALFEQCVAGLVTLYPTINYVDALPVKMFEYMLAGLPVVCSNIPIWKKIVESNGCGIAVNPNDPKEIAEAIDYLILNPKVAEDMGKNGRKAVIEKYNWQMEEAKLLLAYKEVINLN